MGKPRPETPATSEQDCALLHSILKRNPDLGAFGFGVFNGAKLTPAERKAKKASDRAELLSPYGVDDFIRARKWLCDKPRTGHVNPKAGTSYGLKHLAAHTVGYVTNGAFIAAAIAEGYEVKQCAPGSPNAWFNLSKTVHHVAVRGGGLPRPCDSMLQS